MPPEQVRGTRLELRTDIITFGCMPFEMLSGSRAFSGSNQADIVASILKEDPMSRGTFPPDLPPGVLQTLTRCLEKDPDQRFQSSKDILFALKMSESSVHSATVQISRPKVLSIPRKVVVLALSLIVAVVAGIMLYRFVPSRKEIQSLAVLPFVNGTIVNGTNDPETEYLSDGITETLISSLSQVPNLRVMAHDTVFTYKGKPIDPRKIGGELNVEAVVTGRVIQHGNTLIIYANLVKVADGTELWGDQYNKTVADIITMQTDLSREISNKLRARLTGEEQNRVTKKYTENSEAYQLYLKGNFFFWKFTREDYEKSRECFRQAIEKDPKFAEAWAAYADTYSASAFEGFSLPKESLPKAREAAERALALDPSSAHAQLSMGAWHFENWDWAAAEPKMRTAIQLDPNRAETRRLHSDLLRSASKWNGAIAEAKKACELDPLSVVNARTLGITYFWAGQYDHAIEQYQKALELDANRATIHDSLSDVYAKKGMYKEAIEEKQRLLSLSGDEDSATELGQNFEKYGYDQAKKLMTEHYLEAYQQAADEQYISPVVFAIFYTDLNEKDKAFEWLEKAYEEHSTWLINLKTDPQFESLRSDPRFADLVRRIGIP
jgi:TolB-like protein/Tfp pilus assembly protein PilF